MVFTCVGNGKPQQTKTSVLGSLCVRDKCIVVMFAKRSVHVLGERLCLGVCLCVCVSVCTFFLV